MKTLNRREFHWRAGVTLALSPVLGCSRLCSKPFEALQRGHSLEGGRTGAAADDCWCC